MEIVIYGLKAWIVECFLLEFFRVLIKSLSSKLRERGGRGGRGHIEE